MDKAFRGSREFLRACVRGKRAAWANRGRYGGRDALAIRMTARHGFRVSELCELRWDQIDLRAGLIHVTRKKNGVASTHPLSGDEIRACASCAATGPTVGMCL